VFRKTKLFSGKIEGMIVQISLVTENAVYKSYPPKAMQRIVGMKFLEGNFFFRFRVKPVIS